MQLKICGFTICLSSFYWEHYKFVSGPERRLGVLCPFACIDIELRVVVLHFFYWTRQLKFHPFFPHLNIMETSPSRMVLFVMEDCLVPSSLTYLSAMCFRISFSLTQSHLALLYTGLDKQTEY